MGWLGPYFLGEEDEIKLKQFKALFDIEDDEKAKELFFEVKTKLETK